MDLSRARVHSGGFDTRREHQPGQMLFIGWRVMNPQAIDKADLCPDLSGSLGSRLRKSYLPLWEAIASLIWMNSMTITFAPTRRDVLKIAGATLAISDAAGAAALAQTEAGGNKVKAIGFDAFTIFDPRSIEAAVEDIFPGKGKELAAAWRTRLFEYTWLRTLNRTYADFRQV
jgi:hypothetical protein